MSGRYSRRDVLKGAAALGLGMLGAELLPGAAGAGGRGHFPFATPQRAPGSLPFPEVAPGTDTLPQIEHIIVVMMENHSYDNYFGMLHRGDGFFRAGGKRVVHANPDGMGGTLRSYHIRGTCKPDGVGPSQSWNASHISLAGGLNTGFVEASGPIAMGYWDRHDLPFYYGLAKVFPLCDRFFCSVLAQTYPNRRFLLGGSAAGLVKTDPAIIIRGEEPPAGTIFTRLDQYGITWKNYFSDLPQLALYPSVFQSHPDNTANMTQYFEDAAAGTLPSVSYLDPPFLVPDGSEENGDIRAGEDYVAKVVNAAMQGPGWPKTLLIWLYDEHGGYYDHVPPPPALRPDDIPPDITAPPDQMGAYDRLGFRVPAVIVSPFARRHYVSHVVHDHTSVLKLIETKWNLPAITFRDANADNLLDSLDLVSPPAFLKPPRLPASALARGADCREIDPDELGQQHRAAAPPDPTRPDDSEHHWTALSRTWIGREAAARLARTR